MTSSITATLCTTPGTTLFAASHRAAPRKHLGAKPFVAINVIAPKSISTISTTVNKAQINNLPRFLNVTRVQTVCAVRVAGALGFAKVVGVLGVLSVIGLVNSVSAQTLPPVPTSPAPVVTYEYDALGQPTRLIQAPTAVAPAVNNLATSATYDR
jgi:hypothetical protein